MANTVSSLTQVPSGAAFGPAGGLASGPGQQQEPALVAKVTITGDGATTGNVTVNWIDGTQTLPFTPSVVYAYESHGLSTATAGGLASATGIANTNRVNTVSATSFNLNVGAAITNTATLVVFVVAYK